MEIDISGIKAGELRTLKGAYRELGVSKGRLSQLMANDQIDYGRIDDVKLVPVTEIERRRKESKGPGNPNFGKGFVRKGRE